MLGKFFGQRRLSHAPCTFYQQCRTVVTLSFPLALLRPMVEAGSRTGSAGAGTVPTAAERQRESFANHGRIREMGFRANQNSGIVLVPSYLPSSRKVAKGEPDMSEQING